MHFYLRLLAFFILILSACDTLSGSFGASEDIKDAKLKGVFIQEYTVYPNPYKINNTLKIFVYEAWIENVWRYTKNKNKVKVEKDGYQICVNTTSESLKNIYIGWTIGTFDKYLRQASYNSLCGDFDKIPGDTIDYIVQRDPINNDTSNVHVIGHFILFKK